MFKNKLYKTSKPHGNHPAGTICLASRIDSRTILLEYENGDFVEVHGMWCPGLEPVPYYGFEQCIVQACSEEVALEIDQQILGELNAMVEGLKIDEQGRTELPKPPRKNCKQRKRKKR